MTHEQALKKTGEIVAATIEHMAKTEGVTVNRVIELLAEKHDGAVKTFNAYMDIACNHVKSM